MIARHSDFISLTRQEVARLIQTIDNLHALRAEWTALDYGNSITTDDFVGANADTTLAELSSVIGTTLSAIDGLLAAGHATNLYNLL